MFRNRLGKTAIPLGTEVPGFLACSLYEKLAEKIKKYLVATVGLVAVLEKVITYKYTISFTSWTSIILSALLVICVFESEEIKYENIKNRNNKKKKESRKK